MWGWLPGPHPFLCVCPQLGRLGQLAGGAPTSSSLGSSQDREASGTFLQGTLTALGTCIALPCTLSFLGGDPGHRAGSLALADPISCNCPRICQPLGAILNVVTLDHTSHWNAAHVVNPACYLPMCAQVTKCGLYTTGKTT